MQWQLFINTKLNLGNKSPKFISDHTGVLSSKVFLAFLEEKAVSYLVTDKISDMLSVSGPNSELVIITNLKDIPTFITNNFPHLQFTHSDFPLNGEIASILKNLNPETIIDLLEYVYSYDSNLVITKYNIEDILSSAQLFKIKKEINSLIKQLIKLLQTVPQTDKVLNLGKIWGELIYLSVITEDHQYESLTEQVDHFASSFIISEGINEASYASTSNNPKVVDKILANISSEGSEKIALICFDCMGYSEWNLLKDFLSNDTWTYSDTPIFTLLPSVTSISRSAIFHGSNDVYNIKSPGRADEAKAFANFFQNRNTKYFTESDSISNDTLLGYDCISILYTFFDDLCHSVQFPPNLSNKELYFNTAKSYLLKSTVLKTFQTLHENGFVIYICSDHGSVVAFGNGQKLDKYLVDNFAKRAIIVPTVSDALIDYDTIKIPFIKDKLIVLPKGRSMFANNNQTEINHGGITVEEMVVPYIKINR